VLDPFAGFGGLSRNAARLALRLALTTEREQDQAPFSAEISRE